VAYDCRNKPNLLEGNLPFDLSDVVEEDDSSELIVEMLSLTEEDDILPSHLLSKAKWVKFATKLLDLDKVSAITEISPKIKEKADLLVRMIRGRFSEHIKSRIKSVQKRNHWSMKLAYRNLAVSAACMVLTDHTKMDLKCLDESSCLLAINTNSFLPCAAFPDREGCYLYFDVNRGMFVRSGKVTRRGVVVRGDEHHKASKAAHASSHFYFVYPSKESARADKRDKQGFFEHLSQVIRAGFDPKSDSAKLVDRDWKERGSLILSGEEKKLIKASMDKDLASIQKFQDIVAYQFEFGYDLAIAPEWNVSRSPGFESVLGIFGGSE